MSPSGPALAAEAFGAWYNEALAKRLFDWKRMPFPTSPYARARLHHPSASPFRAFLSPGAFPLPSVKKSAPRSPDSARLHGFDAADILDDCSGSFLAERALIFNQENALLSYALDLAPDLLTRRRELEHCPGRGAVCSWRLLTEPLKSSTMSVILRGLGSEAALVALEPIRIRVGDETSTFFHRAAALADERGMRALIQAAGPAWLQAVDSSGGGPLAEAVYHKNAGAMRALLEAGADPSQASRAGLSPASIARDLLRCDGSVFSALERAALELVAAPASSSAKPRLSRL